MLELLKEAKEYWGVLTGFVLVILGLGKLRWDVEQLKSKSFVTIIDCKNIRTACDQNHTLRFGMGEGEFSEIKEVTKRLEDAQTATLIRIEDRHREILHLLLELKK